MRFLLSAALAFAASAIVPPAIAPAPPAKALFQALIVGTHRVPFEVRGGGAVPFDTLERVLGMRMPPHRDGMPQACFRLLDASPMRLVLVGDEMGDEVLTTFSLGAAGRDAELETNCVPLAVRSAAIATDTGLRLGLTRSALEAILGPPEEENGDELVFRRVIHREVTTTPGETDSYDLHFEVTATMQEGKVVALEGSLSDED